ncbi:MAG TPA: glycosyltransferase [Stellaceae bacterium]|nr:glycosyltransferase [Stellaceae bacterium]
MTIFNLFRGTERRAARRAIESAELVIALHSCSADTLEFIQPLAGALKMRRGRLLMFVGNEYNLPWAPLLEKRRLLRDVAPDYVATQLPLEAGSWLYSDSGAAVLALPHALNEAIFRREKQDEERRIDIGGRSARYPVFVGDDERNRVHEIFARIGPEAGLVVDIDCTSGGRLDRAGWARFLNDCRATIGTEAGTWYLDRNDQTVLEIRDFLEEKTQVATLRADGLAHSLSRRLPYGAKESLRKLLAWLPLRHEVIESATVDFAEIEARFFRDRPRAAVYSKCISSRHFDAAGTGTCQILVRGRYNDILTADEHYIALDHDFGNIQAAIERFRDPAERGRISDAAYSLVRDCHTYARRVAELHRVLCAT